MKKIYIESPLQLLCVIPHIESGDIIIIRPTSVSTQNQIDRLVLYFLKDKDVRIIKFPARMKLISIPLSIYIMITGRVDERWYGYHHSKVFKCATKLMPSLKAVLVDDGVATLSINKETLFKRHQKLHMKTIFKNMVDNEKFFYNDLKEVYSKKVKLVGGDKYFVGTKLVRSGIISQGEYLEVLDFFYKEHNVKNYILHRDETIDVDYLESIKSIGFNLVELDSPIEYAILVGDINISSLYGVVSTALITAKQIFNVNTCFLSISDLVYKNKVAIENIEDEFLKYDVKKVIRKT